MVALAVPTHVLPQLLALPSPMLVDAADQPPFTLVTPVSGTTALPVSGTAVHTRTAHR
jgi:hypothetical protein